MLNKVYQKSNKEEFFSFWLSLKLKVCVIREKKHARFDGSKHRYFRKLYHCLIVFYDLIMDSLKVNFFFSKFLLLGKDSSSVIK